MTHLSTAELSAPALRQLQLLAEALLGVAEEEVIAQAAASPPVEARVTGYPGSAAAWENLGGRKSPLRPIEGHAAIGAVEVLRTPTARRAAGTAEAVPTTAASLRESPPGGQSAFADGAKRETSPDSSPHPSSGL